VCYYYNDSDVYVVTIEQVENIIIENATVDPDPGEWGGTFDFNVTAKTNSDWEVNFTLM